ncbi:MAG: hypothetical protein PHH13_02325 [Candidatus Peribacteraceae bacterium]|nr:hypothetical protein [Candidatus Peribacteraceae bacterium]
MPKSDFPQSITFYHYPKMLYMWPLIVAGVLFWVLYFALGPKADTPLGWLYQSILIIVVVTLGIDLRFRHMLVCLVVAMLLIVSLVTLNLAGVDIYTGPFSVLKLCKPYFDAGGAFFTSIILAILYVLMYVWVHFFRKVKISEGIVTVSIYGESDITFLADSRVINVDFPDVLKRLLGPDAGTVTITDTKSGRSVTLQNIPFLSSLKKRIQHLLIMKVITSEKN